MKEEILDEILADPECTLEEATDVIDYYINRITEETKEQMHEDLKHAFST